MFGDEPVTCWLRQLEAGDEDAARLLWQRYYRELVELARARLGTTPRRVADEEDVALSVLRCLYEGAARGQFAELVNRGELWQLSTRTSVGEVGIRARHAPIVARLVPNELRLYESEGSEPDARYAQGEGWLEVFANRARVLIAEAVEPDKLDASELKSKLEDAEKRLEEAEEGSAAEEQAERDKARAEAFMEIAERS